MLKHFSLLFSQRTSSSVNVHSSLCLEILHVVDEEFHATAQFPPEMWKQTLQILMGICDHLLRVPETECILSNTICPYILKILFSLWIRSNTTDIDMWDTLKSMLSTWTHRLPVIMQWIATCTGLTNSVINLLYITHAPKGSVIFQSIGTSEIIEIDQSYMLYSWYRMLHILGNLENIEKPSIYLEAVKGIHQLSRLFHQYLNIKSPIVTSPDVNSILHLFGPFLFGSVLNIKPGFEEGKADSFIALLQLVTSKSNQNIDITYLSYLYSSLEIGLKSGNVIMDAILINSSGLFHSSLKGVRILTPFFWEAIHKILIEVNPKSARLSSELKLACYKIGSYFLSMAGIYNGITVSQLCNRTDLGTVGDMDISKFSSLSSVLLTCLLNEYSDYNKKQLLSILFTYIWENAIDLDQFPIEFIQKVSNSLRELKWTPQIVLRVLETWAALAGIYSLMKEVNKQLPSVVVNCICEGLDVLFDDKDNSEGLNEELIIKSFECLQAWVMESQWLIKSQKDLPKTETYLYKVLKYAFIGKSGRRSFKDDNSVISLVDGSEKIKLAAGYLITLITNKIDNFPSPRGASDTSCVKNEKDIMLAIGAKRFSTFIVDNRIITMFNQPIDDDGYIIVTVISRDATGKYVWSLRFLHSELTHFEDHQIKSNIPSYISEPEVTNDYEKLLKELDSQLADDEKERHLNLVVKMNRRIEEEATKIRQSSQQIEMLKRNHKSIGANHLKDAVSIRTLALHLGWNSIFYRTRCFSVKDQKADFENLLKEIDDIRERDCYTLGVFYIPKESNTEKTILSLSKGSPEYEEFINELGWEVDIHNHTGYTGDINPKATGNTAIYYADYQCELVFHIASLMTGHSHTAQTYKRRLLLSNKVIIVWLDQSSQFKNFEFLRDSSAVVQIVIYPLSPLLFKILINKKNDFDFGPLEDNTIVSKHILPKIVRIACLNALKACTYDLYHSQTKRQLAIDNFIKTNRHEGYTSEYYSKGMYT